METVLSGNLNLWDRIEGVLEPQVKNEQQAEIACKEIHQDLDLKEPKSVRNPPSSGLIFTCS